MYFCLDSEGWLNTGNTLTEAYRKAEKSGRIYDYNDCRFFEGVEIKAEFEVVPATQVASVKKTGGKR